MFEVNPYLGTTFRTPRPTGTEPAYRYQTRRLLARDQHLWDAAEQARSAPVRVSGRDYHPDLVTRIRLEYLATAFGTVAEWNRSHDQIIADALGLEVQLRRQADQITSSMLKGERA
jgi:hypothetical protein